MWPKKAQAVTLIGSALEKASLCFRRASIPEWPVLFPRGQFEANQAGSAQLQAVSFTESLMGMSNRKA